MWRSNVNQNNEYQTVPTSNAWSKYKVSSFMITYVVINVSLQTSWLWTLRDSLWSFGLSSEVQPSSDTSGPEWQQTVWFSSEASVCWTGESKLWTEDSEVSSLTIALLGFFYILNSNSSVNFQSFQDWLNSNLFSGI